MIDHRSHGATGWLIFPHENQDARELRSLSSSEFERSTAHGDPELLRSVHVLHEQMHVAHGYAYFIRGGQLRPRFTRQQKCRETQHKQYDCLSHFSLLRLLPRMMKHDSFLKAEDATLPHGNQGFKSSCRGGDEKAKIMESGNAFAFSTVLCARIMNQSRWRA